MQRITGKPRTVYVNNSGVCFISFPALAGLVGKEKYHLELDHKTGIIKMIPVKEEK